MTGIAGSIAAIPSSGVFGELVSVAPGQGMTLTIDILDQDGNLYVDENDAVAAFDFVDEVSIDEELRVIAGREEIARDGVFNFPSLRIF